MLMYIFVRVVFFLTISSWASRPMEGSGQKKNRDQNKNFEKEKNLKKTLKSRKLLFFGVSVLNKRLPESTLHFELSLKTVILVKIVVRPTLSF